MDVLKEAKETFTFEEMRKLTKEIKFPNPKPLELYWAIVQQENKNGIFDLRPCLIIKDINEKSIAILKVTHMLQPKNPYRSPITEWKNTKLTQKSEIRITKYPITINKGILQEYIGELPDADAYLFLDKLKDLKIKYN